MLPGILPESWLSAVRNGNAMIDPVRKAKATVPGHTFEVEYLLPLEPRFPPPVGRFVIEVPGGAVLKSARKVEGEPPMGAVGAEARERRGSLGLTLEIPKLKLDATPLVFCIVSGREGNSPPGPGVSRRLVGPLSWRGSYRVLAEEKA